MSWDGRVIPKVRLSDPVFRTKGFWYLATPYAKYPHGHNAAWVDACRIALTLMKYRINVFSPIAHAHSLAANGDLSETERNNHAFWMPNDLMILERSCGVLVAQMDGWDQSKGVGMEIDHATELDLPVYLLDLT